MGNLIVIKFGKREKKEINLSFTEKEMNAMKDSAAGYGMDLKEWIRICIGKEMYRDESQSLG